MSKRDEKKVVETPSPVKEPQQNTQAPVNQLPEELRDKFEIVGVWPTGNFEVTGLEVKGIDFSKMTVELAEHLCKIQWKGIRKK